MTKILQELFPKFYKEDKMKLEQIDEKFSVML